MEANDAAVVKRYGETMQEVTNPLVREVFTVAMDVRMVVAALRRRRLGLGPPTVGFGQWFEHIRRHFNQPDFRLGHVFPGIVRFDQLLEQGDVLNLYRHMLGASVDVLEETGRGLRLQLRSRRALHRALGDHAPMAAVAGRARSGRLRSACHGGFG